MTGATTTSAVVLLALSVLAVSSVLGRAPQQQQRQIAEVEYSDEERQTRSEETSAVLGVQLTAGDGGRSANIKFVTAIRKSSIWTDVRRRSLTISTRPRLDGIADKSPDQLSDDELLRLKRAYHDGLKCVAVDHLLALRSMTEATDTGSRTTVRMAIVKITKVLTEYTTEYHEDTYQYEEVTETDDANAVTQSVTAIVEDNRELCQVDAAGGEAAGGDAADGDAETADAGDAGNAADAGDAGDATAADDQEATGDNGATTNLNFGDQNFGTVNNYHINYGTINDATMNGAHADRLVLSGEPPAPSRPSGDENATEVREPETPKYGSPDDGGAPDLGFMFKGGGGGQETGPADDEVARTTETVRAKDHGSSRDERDEPRGNDVVQDEGADIVSAGSNCAGTVKKGRVHHGDLNNGNMKVYNINRGGVENKGEFNMVKADNGIVAVGNVNNGPVNYGEYDAYANNGTDTTVNDTNVLQYASSLDQLYSDIQKRLAQ